jgi:hypothetical protein
VSKLGFLSENSYPKIERRLYLRDYSPEFRKWLREAGQEDLYLDVWVNWSREFEREMQELRWEAAKVLQMPIGNDDQRQTLLKAQGDLMPLSYRLNARFWGCDEDDARAIYEQDVELWNWVVKRSSDLRDEYQEERKKVT